MSGSPVVDRIVAFYSGGRDHRGRTLDEILAWSDDRLESVHDYIQWVFPTRTPSAVNPYAPCVTDATARAFSDDLYLRERLGVSLARMLSFYGLRARPDGTIETDPDRFGDRAQIWLEPDNHNHLRLTRIMESLTVLGGGSPDGGEVGSVRGGPHRVNRDEGVRGYDARALQNCLMEIARQHGGVSSTTLEFWKHATAPR